MLISDLGSSSFYISFFLSIIYYISSFFVKPRQERSFHLISSSIINGLLICSFMMFVLCFVYSDFTLYSVFINSHTAKPLVYKVGAAWSSHEGSMLFWLFVLAIYNLFYSITRKDNFVSLNFQNFFQLIIHGFILITVDPFRRNLLTPLEGTGFNPLLQDYALLIHPPILYLGYAGNLISFSIIVANSFSPYKDWIKSIKPWIMIPWSFLTIGIGLGSWWSYRELGWGGFWAWDPVENVSLLPWLAGLVFIHLSLIKNRSSLVEFFLKLNGIFIFVFSLFATFVVRSGLVSSIHAFATSNERGAYFFILLVVFFLIGVISITFVGKDRKIVKQKSFKEKLIIIESSFIAICYLIIILAIAIPLYLNLKDGMVVSLGEDFYRRAFGIIMIPILLLLNIIPYLNQKEFRVLRLIATFLISGLLIFLLDINFDQLLVLINSFLVISILINYLLYALLAIVRKQEINISSFIAHCGICIMIFGAITSSVNDESVEKSMDIYKNNTIEIYNYKANLNSVSKVENKDFVGIKADFSIWYKNQELGHSYPELKYYKIEEMQLPDSASFYHNFSDIYLLVTKVDMEKNMIMVKVYYKRYVALIWIGCGMIGLSMITGLLLRLVKNFTKSKNNVTIK